MELATSALGLPAERLAVVARLFVSPRARGQRAGRLLLDKARRRARPHAACTRSLDVDTGLAGADRAVRVGGWSRAGEITVRFRDGNTLNEYVYLGPRP